MRYGVKALQTSLFTNYSLMFVVALLAFALLFYSLFSNYITHTVSIQQEQFCSSIVNSLDTEVMKMNTVSMNIVYSNLIKSHFKKYLSLSSPEEAGYDPDGVEKYTSLRTLIDVLIAIIGPFQTVSQVNMYDFQGRMVGAGLFNEEAPVDLKAKDWYGPALQKDGSRYMSVPARMEFLDVKNSHLKSHYFVSLCRVYKGSDYTGEGIVETLQDCDVLFSYVNDIKRHSDNLQIYVLNPAGRYVYPYGDKTDANGVYYASQIKQNSLAPLKIHTVKSPLDGSQQIMTFTTSEYSGWTIIAVESRQVLFAPLNNFTRIFLLFSLLVLALTLLISYLVSKKVTVPLKELRQALKAMDIAGLSSPVPAGPSMDRNPLNEIELLNLAFNSMHRKLGQSLTELLAARTQEMNAKLLAIQSQMNPHFLYNNLAMISVMAEEGMNPEIVSVCNDISYMLRYISTESNHGIELRSEIDYTVKYLKCMKIRYEENLQYEIELPDEMLDIFVPKLIVQPLVENSVKYGLNNQPPWHISIRGGVSGGKWVVTVSDSGTGFDPEIIDELEKRMDSFEDEDFSEFSSLEIDGMGLLNIYIRLKLLYAEDALFTLQNLPGGGASVTIGGRTN